MDWVFLGLAIIGLVLLIGIGWELSSIVIELEILNGRRKYQ